MGCSSVSTTEHSFPVQKQCQTSISSWHIQAKNCLLFNMSYQVSTGTQLVLPKALRTPYLGVGHQTGLGPLCGTPQSPSQSAQTFCSRNSTKGAGVTLLEHSSPHSQICQSTPNQPISFHPVFSATRGFLTVHNRGERKHWPPLSPLIFSSKMH